MTISLFKAQLDVDAVLDELRPILESGWVGLGPKTRQLELELAQYVGAEHVVATSSCTAALQLALHALYLPRGSVVLTTPISFASTAMVCLSEGLEVRFCDVEPDTGNLDASKLEEAIERHRPKALIVVHLGGYPCDMHAINHLAKRHWLPVIEDCAHALGSSYFSEPVGSGGNIYCYSFHAVKNLPTADGGAVASESAVVAERMRRLRWLGIDKSTADRSGTSGGYSWEYEIEEAGFKAHMNDLSAVLGLVGMRTLEAGNSRRRAIASRYASEIVAGTPPDYSPLRKSSSHFLPMHFGDRAAVIRRLEAAGIQYGMHYKPLYRFGPFAGEPLPGAEAYASTELTLPMHLGLSDEDVSAVIDAVNWRV